MRTLSSRFVVVVAIAVAGVMVVGTAGCGKKDDAEAKAKKKEARKKKRLQAKTEEAVNELDKIYRSAANYYSAPRVEKYTGRKIDCQFPANQGMTPDVRNKACCGGALDTDEDDRCDVDTSKWTTMTWSALNFQMNDQHYFGYAFESSGILANAKFTASAYADLDCDGELSTFQRFGYGDPSATHAECSMKRSDELKKVNELE